jgi:flagellar biosynthesis/type III secretory pathway M-ring protein FliF/YscJ
MRPPSFVSQEPEPDFTPTIHIRPRVDRVNPRLSAHIHHLVETYPKESVRVIREWMAEGPARSLRH